MPLHGICVTAWRVTCSKFSAPPIRACSEGWVFLINGSGSPRSTAAVSDAISARNFSASAALSVPAKAGAARQQHYELKSALFFMV